jgi:hypothetical protein
LAPLLNKRPPPPASAIGSKIRASRSVETHQLTILDRRVLVR